MITREPDASNAATTEENTESELAKYMSRKNLFKSIEAAYTVLLDLELMVQDELRYDFKGSRFCDFFQKFSIFAFFSFLDDERIKMAKITK